MFLLQNPPPDEPEPLFYLSFGMGLAIDFCVWVLEQDGLHVPPFDQHANGDGSLRSLGMTADDWRSWVTRTALLLDQRLNWKIDDLATEREHELDQQLQLQQMVAAEYPNLNLPPANSPAMCQAIDRQLTWQLEQFQKATAAVQAIYRDATPPDVWEGGEIEAWQGEPEVAERLREMELHYIFHQREQEWMTCEMNSDSEHPEVGQSRVDTDGLYELLRSYWISLGGLEIHFVAYSKPIEFLISPSAIVMSPSREPNSREQFEERVIGGVDRLIAINESL